MTGFAQGQNPWFQFSDPPGWLARAVDSEALDSAIRWTAASASIPSRPAPSSREDSGADFVRQAIQRSYQ
jgi:hypothetical protein